MLNDNAGSGLRPRRSARDLGIFIEAVAALLLASLSITVLPFRALVRTIGFPRRDRSRPAMDIDLVAAEVTRAIDRAARRLPLPIVCLHQALATHWMLRRRGIATCVHYGISPGGDAALKAHVWVDAGGTIIMGEEESLGFARVATFPAAAKDEQARG